MPPRHRPKRPLPRPSSLSLRVAAGLRLVGESNPSRPGDNRVAPARRITRHRRLPAASRTQHGRLRRPPPASGRTRSRGGRRGSNPPETGSQPATITRSLRPPWTRPKARSQRGGSRTRTASARTRSATSNTSLWWSDSGSNRAVSGFNRAQSPDLLSDHDAVTRAGIEPAAPT